tara:strand:+ start:915 stop:1517 length:603 start_codon:yes stop_codon:yes gene_type:complete
MFEPINYDNQSILIIANGESVLNHKLGNQIDKFKNVVRINNYKINNFEIYSGKKTTIWFNGANQGLIKRTKFPDKIIVSIPSEILMRKKNINSYVANRIKTKNFKIISIDRILEYEKNVGHNRLTTGMYAVMWALENYKNIYIHGYDFFINSKGHYFDNKIIKSLKNNNFIHKGKKHNNQLEKKFMLDLINSKKINYIIN